MRAPTTINYIIDPQIARDNHTPILRAANNSRRILRGILPQVKTICREGDTNELANIRASILPSGQLETAKFVAKQHRDREIYGVPNSELDVLITDKILVDLQPVVGRQNMLGVSYIPWHEGIASLARYFSAQNRAAAGLTHTILHESGHLMGILDECTKSQCAMNNTQSLDFLSSISHEFFLNISAYCAHCLAKIRKD